MMHYFNGFHGFGRCFLGGGSGMIILFIILVVVIYLVLRNKGGTGLGFRNEQNNALDILNERFARGEINEEEYKQKKALLTKHR